MYDALVRAGLQGRDSAGNWATTMPTGGLPAPGCWSSANSVIFPADSGGDTRNLWETGISLATGKVSGAFRDAEKDTFNRRTGNRLSIRRSPSRRRGSGIHLPTSFFDPERHANDFFSSLLADNVRHRGV
jgi:hypothetical protein